MIIIIIPMKSYEKDQGTEGQRSPLAAGFGRCGGTSCFIRWSSAWRVAEMGSEWLESQYVSWVMTFVTFCAKFGISWVNNQF